MKNLSGSSSEQKGVFLYMDYLTVFDSHLRNMEYADHQNFFPIHFDSCQDPLLIQQYLYIDILFPSQIVQSHLPLFYFPALDS